MNIQKIKMAAEIAKAKTSDKRWTNAINAAVDGVENKGWIVTYETHGICVTTENGTYFANGVCGCKAFANGQACKHRALARLVAIADGLEDEPETPAVSLEATWPVEFKSDVAKASREHLIIEIENVWPRFSTTPLAIALEARFGCNSLKALDDDMLRRVRLAIAA